MKKLLGISLVAILTATPLMAGAAVTDAVPEHATETADITAATTNVAPKYKLMGAGTNDENAASAGYVKGAYNAAIKAINAVDERIDTVADGKQDTLTEGNGIDITNNVVTAVGDGTTIGVDATNNIHIVDGGVGETQLGTGAVTNTKLGDNAVTTDKIQNGTIIVEDVNNTALSKGIDANAENTKLTTQGYVDEQIAEKIDDLNIGGYAKKVGVTQTITDSTITVTDGKTVSTSLSGVNGITASTTVPIMNTWGSDVPATTPLAATTTVDASSLGVSSTLGGTITASITGATYAEP